jgi:hypothetical protein
LAVGIPIFTTLILGIYVAVWAVNNANPALIARQADGQMLRQVISTPQSVWEEVGTGGVANPWQVVQGQPTLMGDHALPKLFYVGGEFCEFCATQRWALLNALGRFGTFTNLLQVRSFDDQIATFTFYQSAYSSTYLDFAPVEHIGNTKDIWGQFTTLQAFEPDEQILFDTYATDKYLPAGNGLPFIDLGNRFLLGGGLDPVTFENAAHAPLSWQEIAASLTDLSSPIAQQVLGTANFLAAAICMETNQQPGAVCETTTIQQIEPLLERPSAALAGAYEEQT